MEEMIIRPVINSDADEIAAIYNPYIVESTITFEEEPIPATEIQRRMAVIQSLGFPWLCARVDKRLVGYAYASRWRERPAYRFTAESTIYLDREFSGHGYGTKLYSTLLDLLRSSGFHVAMGVITIPNPASITLHEKLGFRKVAHFNEVGYKFGRWLDVGYWQLML